MLNSLAQKSEYRISKSIQLTGDLDCRSVDEVNQKPIFSQSTKVNAVDLRTAE